MRNRHAAGCEIPVYRKASQAQPLDATYRWALARRLLQDDTVPVRDGVAGLFVLLYAQPLTAITQLTTGHISQSDDGSTHLRFGDTPVALPDELAELLADHLHTRSAYYVVGRESDTHWLFPGVHRHTHISVPRLGARLRRLSIHARAARGAALLDLATQLPATVLAELLGISARGADRWVSRTGSSWASYAADIQRRIQPERA